MARILIIGYGNPLYGDDGLGPYAAARLSEMVRDPEVAIRSEQQLTPEMAEEVSQVEQVLFLDVRGTGTPGEFTREEVYPAVRDQRAVSHQLQPSELLELSRRVYGKCPQATLFSLAGERFGQGEEFSPAVQAALPRYLEAILTGCKQIKRSE
jgi:hydrogenase maturation protease